MLHEEVILDWNDLQNVVQDFHFMDSIRQHLVIGVSLHKTICSIRLNIKLISNLTLTLVFVSRGQFLILVDVLGPEKFCKGICTRTK